MNPVSFYKCLADDTRLRSLMLIYHETELCVCELIVALELSQPKVSRHLAQLRKCGLLVDTKQAQWVYYKINPQLPDWALQVLAISALENKAFLQPNLARLEQMGDRPQRQNDCC